MDNNAKQKISRLISPGRFEYFETITSTNEIAHQWVRENAPNFSLLLADEQTKGRGRNNRTWFTPPNSALAFSLILTESLTEEMPYYTGLGAVAVCWALEQYLQLSPKIKWPNDILIDGKKISGILVESSWVGNRLQAVIIGIGINISPDCVPPPEQLLFPASSVESHTTAKVNRFDLLKEIITQIKTCKNNLTLPQLIEQWNERLAFKGSQVYLESLGNEKFEGTLVGIDQQGKLILQLSNGATKHFASNEIHLRPQ